MIDLKKCDINTLKTELDKAMEAGDIYLVDAISEELIGREGLNIEEKMPKDFETRIEKLATSYQSIKKTKNGRRRKYPVVLAAALILILCLGTVAYAAGILFPKEQVNTKAARIFPFDQETPEYKAALDYTRYLDKTYVEHYFDPWEHPIYADEAKVKELSDKYGLKYATEKSCMRTVSEVKSQLQNRGFDKLLTETFSDRIKASLEALDKNPKWKEPTDYMVKSRNYVLDDGTLHIGWDSADGKADYEVTFMPKGVFPHMRLGNESVTFASKETEKAFTYENKDGQEFYCIPDGNSNYRAFSTVGNDTFEITAEGKYDSNSEKESKKIDSIYEKRAKKELGLSGLEELINKATQWQQIVMEKDHKALNAAEQKFYISKDDSEMKALEKKYSTCTKAEKALYHEYSAKTNKVQNYYTLSKDDFRAFLDQFHF